LVRKKTVEKKLFLWQTILDELAMKGHVLESSSGLAVVNAVSRESDGRNRFDESRQKSFGTNFYPNIFYQNSLEILGKSLPHNYGWNSWIFCD
jgi:hypothetical protein